MIYLQRFSRRLSSGVPAVGEPTARFPLAYLASSARPIASTSVRRRVLALDRSSNPSILPNAAPMGAKSGE